MESPAGSKENYSPHNPGFNLSKAMETTAAAMRADPIPDSACLTPRNGKRKMPPPAPLLAALFGPDYQTMSPDPRLPPFNERMAGMHGTTTSSALAGDTGASAAPTAGPSLLSAVRSGTLPSPRLPSPRLPEALRQKLPYSLLNPSKPGTAAAGAANVNNAAPPSIKDKATDSGKAAATAAELVAQDGSPIAFQGAAATREGPSARPIAAAAMGDIQAAILYSEAEKIMEFLQDRRNLARLATEFDDRLRAICETFGSTTAPTEPPQPPHDAPTPAAVTTAAAADTAAKAEPVTYTNTNTNAQQQPEGTNNSTSPSDPPAKRRRRPPVKHEGFCVADYPTGEPESPAAGAGDAAAAAGGAKDAVASGNGQNAQGLLHGGAKLDATAAADHTAALYCCINETLERLASRKMYKSGATSLREGVDRALLMCSQLETSAGQEGIVMLESVLNNPLPAAKFPWSRYHEALRLARLALHSMQQLFTSGLGDFKLEVSFSPSCTLKKHPKTEADAAVPGTTSAGGADAALHHSAASAGTDSPEAVRSGAAHEVLPQQLIVSSPGRAAAAVAAAAHAPSAQNAASPADAHARNNNDENTPTQPTTAAGNINNNTRAHDNEGAAPMDIEEPAAQPSAFQAAANAAAINGTQALSRSASCALEGENGSRKVESRSTGAAPFTTPKQAVSENPATVDAANAGASQSLLHTLANAATATTQKLPEASQHPSTSSPPAMAPSATAALNATSQQMNVAELFAQFPMQAPAGSNSVLRHSTDGSTQNLPKQNLPEASAAFAKALGSLSDGGMLQADAAKAAAAASAGLYAPSSAFAGLGGLGGALAAGQLPPHLDPNAAGAAAFQNDIKIEPLSRPAGPTLAAAGAVSTDELMNAFDEASELRLRALGAVGGAMAAGRGGKRRRVDGGRTFHQSIGIGNVGKKGGSDTPGGVQVSMVALCNYILSHGGWEKMKSDREAKLELLKHFGWDHGLPAGKSAVFKEDKAIQSLTTQVREYFVKTGVFHVLNTNRISADGTQTTSGALDTSPTDAQYGSMRANPDLLGTPALHGFHSGAAVGGAAGAAGGSASAAPGANPGAAPYNVPTLSGRAFTDPSDHQARANAAGFALPTQAGLPITCNTDPLPQRSTHDVNQNRNNNQQGATISASMLSAPQAPLPAALPFPPDPSGGPLGSSDPDRTAALRMQALMEAMHVMQTHGANSYAAQQAALLAQATGRLGGGVQPHAPPVSTTDPPPTSGILAGDLDIMRQLASRMGAPKATSGPANSGGLSLPAALSQMMWAPQAGADANAQGAAAAAATPASSTAAAAAAAAPAAAAADSTAAAQGSGAPSGGASGSAATSMT